MKTKRRFIKLAVGTMAILLSAVTFADSAADSDGSAGSTNGAVSYKDTGVISYDTVDVLNIIDTSVVNTRGDVLGDIDKIVQSAGDKLAVIGLSGSFKEVAIPLSDLSVDNHRVVVDMTRSELESLQDVDLTDFEELEPGQYSQHEFSRFEKMPSKH